MTQHHGQASTVSGALTDEALDRVAGGMKWDRNHQSPNVIDARGGQITFLGMSFTLDINGKVSSVSPAT